MNPKLFLTHHDSQDFSSGTCGCILERRADGEGANFLMCPLHAAAAQLLKACKAARISIIDDEKYAEFKPLLKTLEAAIAKAAPPKPSESGWFA